MAEVNPRKFRRRTNAALLAAVISFSLLVFYITISVSLLHRSHSPDEDALSISGNFTEAELKTLAEVLRDAALEDEKTVLLAPLNSAWSSPGGMLDVFLEGFRAGEGISYLLDHLVVVALDKVAYARCLHSKLHCFQLKTDGVDLSGEQLYMSEAYVKMNKRRLYFQGIVLQLGFNFIFTDIDIVWLRAPFQHFSKEADFQVTCDRYSRSTPNMGLVYARSNERTIRFFNYWHEQNILHPEQNEQEVFSYTRYTPEFMATGVKLHYLPTAYFGGLCEKRSLDIAKVCTMHANCCKGTMKKLGDLRLVLDDWKRFQSLSTHQREKQTVQFRAPRQCRKTLIQFLQ